MITTIQTLRNTVISLLRAQGYSPIEALARWNNTYSPLWIQTEPGTIRTFIIGRYEVTFTKERKGIDNGK